MNLIQRIDALLPQTQCGKCGHSGCMPYAEGIAKGEAINKCPPGGQETITGLAKLLQIPTLPLDTDRGLAPAQIAFIREAECIGCTKCIQACPVDAIVGAAKLMHTVLTDECTGCDLCVAPCPVDCIDMLPLPPDTRVPMIGDLPLSTRERQARERRRNHARLRHERRNARLQRELEQRQSRPPRPSAPAATALESAHAGPHNPALKQARITLAMSRAHLNKSLKAFGHPPIHEQAIRLVQLQAAVEAAEQALTSLEQGPAMPAESAAPAAVRMSAADLKRTKIQLAMARASLNKAQAAGAPAAQLALLTTQIQSAEQAIRVAEQPNQ